MRFRYLRDHRSTIFNVMLLNGTLNQHLEETDRQANDRLERLILQMAVREGVTEQRKAANPIKWIACMNNIRSRAEEIVQTELIFV